MTAVPVLDVLERRLRQFNLFGVVPQVVQEAAEALALLRQERTQVQGLIRDWRQAALLDEQPHVSMAGICADQLEATLSGACVSPEAQDK